MRATTLFVGHADDEELLNHNLAHHFNVGFVNVVVVTERPDAAAAAVVARFDPRHAFHYVLEEHGDDIFLKFFFGPATWAKETLEPEWIAFCDTDEFIVARSGSILDTRATSSYDMIALPRYVVVPQKDEHGRLVDLDCSHPERLPLATGSFDIKHVWLSGDRSTPYVFAQGVPKVMTRSWFVDGVFTGGHGVVTDRSFVTRAVDADLAIVHVPFSTLPRFARKIDGIRSIFARYSDRFGPEDAWHWRVWAGLDDAEIAAEFEAQVSPLDRTAPVTTIETIFALADTSPPITSPSTFAMLKDMVRHLEPVREPALPAWIDIVFDANWYFERNEAVREAVARGTTDLRAHFLTYGIVNGLSPSRRFDPHFVRGELERRTENSIDLRDVYWLYFSLPENQRPASAPADPARKPRGRRFPMAPRRRIIFVLGMSRSGTSALTRTLALAGGHLPHDLLGENPGNVRGHWEPLRAIDLNDAFMQSHRSNYYDSTFRLQSAPFADTVIDDPFVDEIAEFLRSCSVEGTLVVKDPRIVAVAPYWFRAAARVGLSVRCAISIRNPREVAGSLFERDELSADFSNLLWLKYNLLAERVSRNVPRVFVDYAALLADWRTQLDRVVRSLDVDLHAIEREAIDAFIDPALNRNVHRSAATPAPLLPLTEIVYEQLRGACVDAPIRTATLNDALEFLRERDTSFAKDFGGIDSPRGVGAIGAWDSVGERFAAELRSFVPPKVYGKNIRA